MAAKVQVTCTNVFKNNNSILLKNDFNKKFIELINQTQKNKTIYKEDVQIIANNI